MAHWSTTRPPRDRTCPGAMTAQPTRKTACCHGSRRLPAAAHHHGRIHVLRVAPSEEGHAGHHRPARLAGRRRPRCTPPSGLQGTIAGITDDNVDLEIAPGVVTTWMKLAVAGPRRDDEDDDDDFDEDDDDDADVDAEASTARNSTGRPPETEAEVRPGPAHQRLTAEHSAQPRTLCGADVPISRRTKNVASSSAPVHPVPLPDALSGSAHRRLPAGVPDRGQAGRAQARHRPAGRHPRHADRAHPGRLAAHP